LHSPTFKLDENALPPLYFLHVWWARRPLTTSRAAILTSVLPQWSADFPASLREKFPNEATYHGWFMRLIGIYGDPVAARKLINYEKSTGIARAWRARPCAARQPAAQSSRTKSRRRFRRPSSPQSSQPR